MSGTAKVETMTKGAFAQTIGVSPGRISQYVAEGKLYGDALVGEGRSARIVPDVARKQLNKTLEPSQRLGANGAVIRSVKAPAAEEPLPLAPTPQLKSADDKVHDELAAERLKQQRIKTAQAERAESLEAGRYMLTDDARREMGRAVGEAFNVMERALREMSNAVAAEIGGQQRDIHQVLARSFREVRAKNAATFRTQTEATAARVPDEPEDMRTAS